MMIKGYNDHNMNINFMTILGAEILDFERYYI